MIRCQVVWVFLYFRCRNAFISRRRFTRKCWRYLVSSKILLSWACLPFFACQSIFIHELVRHKSVASHIFRELNTSCYRRRRGAGRDQRRHLADEVPGAMHSRSDASSPDRPDNRPHHLRGHQYWSPSIPIINVFLSNALECYRRLHGAEKHDRNDRTFRRPTG